MDCSPDEVREYTDLSKEFRDVFAWSYDGPPGIFPHTVECGIRTYPDVRPIRLVDHGGTALAKPRNGLYLKKYYA